MEVSQPSEGRRLRNRARALLALPCAPRVVACRARLFHMQEHDAKVWGRVVRWLGRTAPEGALCIPVFFGGGLEHIRECSEGPVCDCARKPACPGRKQLVLGHTSTLTVLDWAQYAAAWHGRTLKWASGTEKCGRSCPPRIVCHAVAVTLHTHTPGAYRSCGCTTCVCCARGAAIRRSRSVASGCPSALVEDRLAFQKLACLRGTCTPLQ